jgi:hypothetical protein
MNEKQEIIITKIDIEFFNLIWFLVKLSIAAVPAAIIVIIFWWFLSMILIGMVSV